MATRILTANANLSTSAGSWRRAEASNVNLAYPQAAAWDDINTVRYVTPTFANAGNQAGIALFVRASNTTSGTVTILLQENVAGTWTTRTTDTWAVNAANFPDYHAIQWFPLTAYAVSVAAGTWRYAISCSVASRIAIGRGSVAASYWYLAALDVDTAAPGVGDVIAIADGVTLTLDQSLTLGQSADVSVFLCNDATLGWETPALAAYTLTMSGGIGLGHSGNVIVGSVANPVAAANRATIDWSGAAATAWFVARSIYYADQPYARWALQFYGAESANISADIASNAASGQADIVTVQDMSAIWSIGDAVSIVGKAQSGADNTTYTISNIVGTTVTLSANLTSIAVAGGHIVNLNERDGLGVWLVGNSKGVCSWAYNQAGYWGRLVFVGTHLVNTSLQFGGDVTSGQTRVLGRLGASADLFRSVLLSPGTITQDLFTLCKSDDAVIENVHVYMVDTRYAYGFALLGNRASISNVSMKGRTQTYNGWLVGNDQTISNLAIHGGNAAYALKLQWATATVNGAVLTGGGVALWTELHESSLTGLRAEGASGYNAMIGTSVNVAMIGCTFGATLAAGTKDIWFVTDQLAMLVANGCSIGASGVGNIANAVLGSRLLSHTHNATANDHRSWWKYGLMQSVGDGLVDTTVHTAGAGKFAPRFEPQSSTNRLEWTHDAPTGNIQAQTMTVAVWCKINAAAYYAGTHQLPRLTVDYDDGTLAYAQALANTGWQLLSVVFTPATTYGQITITMSGMTDAAGANAYVYWDDGLMLYPVSYVLNMGGMDLFADALPVTPLIATVFSAQDVWEAQTVVMTGLGTIGKRMVDNVDTPISTRAPSATALSTVDWTALRAAALDNLDVLLSTRAVPGDAMALTPAERVILETLFGASGLTLAEAMTVLLAHAVGKTRDMEIDAPVFRDLLDTQDVIAGTLDADGNRTAVVVTP